MEINANNAKLMEIMQNQLNCGKINGINAKLIKLEKMEINVINAKLMKLMQN